MFTFECSGYMSPEYAMEGLFSEKSDVFSFGVLVLEIVSGRRNSSSYGNVHALNLLGFVSLNNSFITHEFSPFADTKLTLFVHFRPGYNGRKEMHYL